MECTRCGTAQSQIPTAASHLTPSCPPLQSTIKAGPKGGNKLEAPVQAGSPSAAAANAAPSPAPAAPAAAIFNAAPPLTPKVHLTSSSTKAMV
jgi:hypothetical protein